MDNISDLIKYWIACSNDVWIKWFANRRDGANNFPEVEEKLLSIIVQKYLPSSLNALSAQDFFSRLKVRYINPFVGDRQVCVIQNAGNVYCKTERVAFYSVMEYKVKDIDTMGTMMNAKPYVEIVVGTKFVLESPESLLFLIDTH